MVKGSTHSDCMGRVFVGLEFQPFTWLVGVEDVSNFILVPMGDQ
jgi:hypothetical protein